jgi:hypothetical protein
VIILPGVGSGGTPPAGGIKPGGGQTPPDGMKDPAPSPGEKTPGTTGGTKPGETGNTVTKPDLVPPPAPRSRSEDEDEEEANSAKKPEEVKNPASGETPATDTPKQAGETKPAPTVPKSVLPPAAPPVVVAAVDGSDSFVAPMALALGFLVLLGGIMIHAHRTRMANLRFALSELDRLDQYPKV